MKDLLNELDKKLIEVLDGNNPKHYEIFEIVDRLNKRHQEGK